MIVKGRHKWLANKTIESEFTPKYEQIFTDKWILTFTEDSLINVWEVYLLTFLSGQCVILKNISLPVLLLSELFLPPFIRLLTTF